MAAAVAANNNQGIQRVRLQTEPNVFVTFEYRPVPNTLRVQREIQGGAEDPELIDLNRKIFSTVQAEAHYLDIIAIFESGNDGIQWGIFNNSPIYIIDIPARIDVVNANNALPEVLAYRKISVTKYDRLLDTIHFILDNEQITLEEFVADYTLPNGAINYKKFVDDIHTSSEAQNIKEIHAATNERDDFNTNSRFMDLLETLAQNVAGGNPFNMVEDDPEYAAQMEADMAAAYAQQEAEAEAAEAANPFFPSHHGILYAKPPRNRNQLEQRNIPAGATNTITMNNIQEGNVLANFYAKKPANRGKENANGKVRNKEYNFERYYKANTLGQIESYRKMVPVNGNLVEIVIDDKSGYKFNPATGVRIDPGNVRYYRARMMAAANEAAAAGGGGGGAQGGGRRGVTKKRSTSKRRSATKKRRSATKKRHTLKKKHSKK
jgi:hypothetical protein